MQKKILMLAYDFPPNWGGVATYGWELAHEFQNQGCKVTVMTQNRGDFPETELNIIPLKLPKTGLLSIPAWTTYLIQHLRKNEYDHIFCNLWLPEATSLHFALTALKKQIPYSVSVHAMEIVESSETVKKRLRKKMSFLKKPVFGSAKKIFCVSRFTKKLLQKQTQLPIGNIEVVANGANPNHFFKTKDKTVHPTLFTASRLLPNKGIDQVIKALPRILKEFPKTEYRISGDGPDKQRLIKLTEMMGVKDSVKFLGKISNEQLIDEYSQSHLCVMLSRKQNHYVEGFGLVFLEAALCETASLGGNSGGIPDAIQDNQTGWLVDPYNPQEIEAKLLELLKDSKNLFEMGQKAKEFTLNNRQWKHCAEKILKHLGEAQ